ncbi:YqiA/YcfP family alpha/beta fold hydrolase [Hyalangium rubrum]|uniref:YqiA/YcfP family alpha/beta fold hydrolase n=1 Tax=Hyalangium rubrum TaxID=3103134 RepID=A0ABU5H6T4_9BACT|nr:YqiA/YcfP family alpha/beta fold hydrolase [Hyalangium sp. s54d21]MDY7228832.1 YqiA/YcfP family alpha/beta fold hydrolase [Hyalangium sp. s54d21]
MNVEHAPHAGPRWLYLHGFASGPESAKGVALAEHYARQGIHLERLNLRQPSLEHLRLSAMMRTVREAIGGERERAILFGSSLGGLTACRVAEEDARVCALVLLAPALRGMEQMRRSVGVEGMRRWEETGWVAIHDHAEKRMGRVDFGFARELEVIDGRSGGWPDVRVPTLIIHGRQDDTTDIHASRQWAQGKRHVRLIEVDDGHELRDSLGLIAAEADDFLRAFRGPPGV